MTTDSTTKEHRVSQTDSPSAPVPADDVREALYEVVDPELGINIIDLGLVYEVTIDESNAITIDMTLTSAACPLTPLIESQVRGILARFSDTTVINWVWTPPWGPHRITDEGREQLRALGFNV
jgi:metal-sulfur cluster biosynthetic enzyme